MLYYCDLLTDIDICLVINNVSYEKNKIVLSQYFVNTVDILHEYPSTSGQCREFLNRNSVLLYAPTSIITFLNLLDIKILLLLNSNSIDKKITDQSGSSISISCL